MTDFSSKNNIHQYLKKKKDYDTYLN